MQKRLHRRMAQDRTLPKARSDHATTSGWRRWAAQLCGCRRRQDTVHADAQSGTGGGDGDHCRADREGGGGGGDGRRRTAGAQHDLLRHVGQHGHARTGSRVVHRHLDHQRVDRHTETADRIAITRRSCATGE